jgi:signal transduction histidine kinase
VQASGAGLPARVDVVGDPRPLPPEAEEALFRAAQEGLTNVRKHAGAASARVVLHYGDDGCVRLEVRDDGRGLTGTDRGFGLVGLRERAARVHGRVELSSLHGAGASLVVEVPG